MRFKQLGNPETCTEMEMCSKMSYACGKVLLSSSDTLEDNHAAKLVMLSIRFRRENLCYELKSQPRKVRNDTRKIFSRRRILRLDSNYSGVAVLEIGRSGIVTTLPEASTGPRSSSRFLQGRLILSRSESGGTTLKGTYQTTH